MQGWQHQRIDALSHPLANRRGQEHIHVHAHVMAVLFKRADWQEQHPLTTGNRGFVLLPCELAYKDTFIHCFCPLTNPPLCRIVAAPSAPQRDQVSDPGAEETEEVR
ncbi:hypothetical protein D3C72_2001650 [compost metagenome]